MSLSLGSLWYLTPLSTIFQLYSGGHFCWRKLEDPEKTPDPSQVTDKLYHIILHRVHLAWAGFKLTTLVVICTYCIGSYKLQLPYDHGYYRPCIIGIRRGDSFVLDKYELKQQEEFSDWNISRINMLQMLSNIIY